MRGYGQVKSGIHLSIRVPWHDSGWNGAVCSDPSANASCVLLKNIAKRRDDTYEISHAGRSFDDLEQHRVACLLERGSFMSGHSYQVMREHPYQFTDALRGKVAPTRLTIPAFGAHAIPYFWLHRDNLEAVCGAFDVEDYDDAREEQVDRELGFRPEWVIHGDNQKALIERFFSDVRPEESLVFFYVKHSPFDSSRSGGPLLVGAARLTGIELPGRYDTHAPTPFPNHMWETCARHSLRPDGAGGILLPVAELARRHSRGDEVEDALAWAPSSADREFMYVTEHVSSDSAISALERLLQAAVRCRELGIEVPQASLDWVAERIGEVWTARGPAPGLGAVLTALGVAYGEAAGRSITRNTPDGKDPWDFLTEVVRKPHVHPEAARWISDTHRKIWPRFSQEELTTLKLLSRFQLTGDQTKTLFAGKTEIPLKHRQLIADPYLAHVLTVGGAAPIAFEVIDRGCFPSAAIRAEFPLPEPSAMSDGADRRRVRALMVDVLEDAALEGDTLLPLDDVMERAEQRTLTEKCPLNEHILRAHELHPEQLRYDSEIAHWPPIVGAHLQDGTLAVKLARLETTAFVIREGVKALLRRPRVQAPGDLEASLEVVLGTLPEGGDERDAESERVARQEKTAALAELYAAPLSVLNGRAGTGKTTLIKALVSRPEIRSGRVLLLAPTGKARVQLGKKAGFEAQTIAQFLARYERYDGATSTYLVASDKPRPARYNTVVVDESSMLTEEQLAALLDALGIPDRLIFVGDPRQLPPIGAGRPFVDLVTLLKHRHEVPAFPRVAPGYAELTELRRQKGEVRDDLKLAAWFSGDEIPKGYEEVWHQLRTGEQSDSLSAVAWDGRKPVEVVDAALASVLGVSDSADFEVSYGGRRKDQWIQFPQGPDGAAANAEVWQIISPTRGYAWGTVEINRHLKQIHRRDALDRAQLPNRKRFTPKPIGAELIVLGDKVMNNVNARRKAYPKGTGLGYVANGEIGVVVGQLRGKSGAPPRYTNIEFSSQLGSTYGYLGESEENPTLELAWSITIHKAQGSEFGKVFVMLPESSRRLSREMLYTALTRQQDRVVLLHEAPLDELLDLSIATGSETARRLTDLFFPPDPLFARFADGRPAGRQDRRLIHAAVNGILVQSKNEVIVAGILEKLVPGHWQYNQPLELNGKKMRPDFTIVTADRTLYWEHLGMLQKLSYRESWERKKEWYRAGGVLPLEDGGGPNGTLVCSDDLNGVKVEEWTALAREAIGTLVLPPVVPPKTKPIDFD